MTEERSPKISVKGPLALGNVRGKITKKKPPPPPAPPPPREEANRQKTAWKDLSKCQINRRKKKADHGPVVLSVDRRHRLRHHHQKRVTFERNPLCQKKNTIYDLKVWAETVERSPNRLRRKHRRKQKSHQPNRSQRSSFHVARPIDQFRTKPCPSWCCQTYNPAATACTTAAPDTTGSNATARFAPTAQSQPEKIFSYAARPINWKRSFSGR